MSLTPSPHLQAARQHAESLGKFAAAKKRVSTSSKKRPPYRGMGKVIALPYSTPIYAIATARKTAGESSKSQKNFFKLLSMEGIDGVLVDDTGRRYIEVQRKLSKDARLEYDNIAKDYSIPDDEKVSFDNVTSKKLYEFDDVCLRVKNTAAPFPIGTIVLLSNVHISHWFIEGTFMDLFNAGKVDPQYSMSSDGLLFEFLANSPTMCDKPLEKEFLNDPFVQNRAEYTEKVQQFVDQGGNPDDAYKKVKHFHLTYGENAYFLSTFGRDLDAQAAKASLDEGVLIDRIFSGTDAGLVYNPEVYNRAKSAEETVVGFETNIFGDQWSGGPLDSPEADRTRFKVYVSAYSSALTPFRIPTLSAWTTFGPILMKNNFLLVCRENMKKTAGLQTSQDAGDEEGGAVDAEEYDYLCKMKAELVVCNMPFLLASSGIPIGKEQAASLCGFLDKPSTAGEPAKFAPLVRNPHHSECRHSQKDPRAADVICVNFYEGATVELMQDYFFFAITNQDYHPRDARKMKAMPPNELSIVANKDAVARYNELDKMDPADPTYDEDVNAFKEKYGVDPTASSVVMDIIKQIRDPLAFDVLVYAVKKPMLLYQDMTKDKLTTLAKRFGFEYDLNGPADFVKALAEFINQRAFKEHGEEDEEDEEEDESNPLKRPRSDDDSGAVADLDDDDNSVASPSPAKKAKSEDDSIL